jgi:fructose-1,6-bisphosphatase/inositol monophosphatase family enzyme
MSRFEAMSLPQPEVIVERLRELQRRVRDVIIHSHTSVINRHDVARLTSADTIYRIDAEVDPILVEFCEEWAKSTPLVLIAEGLEDDAGNEVEHRIFPRGAKESDAVIRVIVDPIDGTRGIMYDKRSAWSLAGVAPNKGPGTRLRDIEVSVMTELPTSKMGFGDVLWAIKGQGATGIREDIRTKQSVELPLRPSQANDIEHGFASVVSFFPGAKVLAAELMEHLVRQLIGKIDVTKATVFDDQYITTGGQFYELIVGHDRFIADVRGEFYAMLGLAEGFGAHPYDCAALLIAEEAGVVITNAHGEPLDGPFDTTTGLSWIGYSNGRLRKKIEPLVLEFIRGQRGMREK